MTYCFTCQKCGRTQESSDRDLVNNEFCPCGGVYRRDYRAENAGVNVANLVRDRTVGSATDLAPLVLPTARYFEGPGDLDGQKGLRDWAEKVRPKSDNKRPVYPPDLKRRSF